MSALAALVLALPVLGAMVVMVVPARHGRVGRSTAAVTAIGWVVLVAGSDPVAVTLGRLEIDPVTACAAAGLAILVAGVPMTTPTSTSAALSGVTLFAAAASIAAGPGPDRPLAAGVVLLAVLAGARFRAEHSPLPGAVLAVAGALVVAAGLSLDDPERVAMVVLVGAGGVVIAAAVWATPGVLLFPAVLLAAGRAAAAADVRAGDVDLVAAVGVAVGVLGAIGLAAGRHVSWVQRVAISGVLAALVVLAQDVTDLRSAGLLLGAGATLALVGGQPVALVALAPGVHALAQGVGLLTDRGAAGIGGPEAAAGGVALVSLVLVALVPSSPAPPAGVEAVRTGRWPRPTPSTIVAVAFGLAPVWAWSGARTDGYGDGLVVATAATVAAGVAAYVVTNRSTLPPAGSRIEAAVIEAPVEQPAPPASASSPTAPVADASAGPGRAPTATTRRTPLQARRARPEDRPPPR